MNSPFFNVMKRRFAFLVAILIGLSSRGMAAPYPGTATLRLVPNNCTLGEEVQVSQRSLFDRTVLESNARMAYSRFALSQLAPGRYFIKATSGTCVARFFMAIFSGIDRQAIITAYNSNSTRESPDQYVVPYDAIAVKLPFESMIVTATSEDGKPLPVQIQGAFAFVDDIPIGNVTVIAGGANFAFKKQLKVVGENRTFLAAIP